MSILPKIVAYLLAGPAATVEDSYSSPRAESLFQQPFLKSKNIKQEIRKRCSSLAGNRTRDIKWRLIVAVDLGSENWTGEFERCRAGTANHTSTRKH